jgi:predicted dehydrogenase
MVAQHMRFEPGNERLKEIVERGTLGAIYTANATWVRRRGLPGAGKFHLRRESRGGPVIDLGVHVTDLTLWLLGFPKVISVNAKTWLMFGNREDVCTTDWGRNYPAEEFDVEDYANAYIRLENGMVLTLEVSWAANIPDMERVNISVLGDKAGLTTNPPAVYGARGNSLTTERFDWLPRQGGHRMEIRHFAECVEKDLPVRVRPEESLRIQEIIDAIYESSRRNREVVLR